MALEKNTKIAITGGAGYIGSFTVKYLKDLGFENLVVLDNFSTGHPDACFSRFIDVNLLDSKKLNDIFDEERFEAVIHFASLIVVPHSMTEPYLYFHHNLNSSLNLLEAMAHYEVSTIVFSSSCAVYGSPKKLPISEEELISPESVYAETKAMIEKMITWYGKIYNINYSLLRYFNACGAESDGSNGEAHRPETHLIPSAIGNVLQGQSIHIYGSDYDTPDGTCIRDYIHVNDLASSHHLALKHSMETQSSEIFNLGVGRGHSNLEVAQAVLDSAQKRGLHAEINYRPRRAGDVPVLYADNTKAQKVLNWKPEHDDIKKIVEEAFVWHEKKFKM